MSWIGSGGSGSSQASSQLAVRPHSMTACLGVPEALTPRADATFTVTVVPGDGVGPKLMTAVKEVFKYCVRVAGWLADLINEALLSLPGYSTRHNNLVIIREQTEGEYSSLDVPGVIECLKIITREFAFRLRHQEGSRQSTRNLVDGLFLQCCAEVAELYPKIKYDNLIIDNCCMQLVQNPYQFDVLVMPNLYVNIIDNLAAGLVDGAGVVPGESYSAEYAVFETVSRSLPEIQLNQNIGNPTAMLLSTANMLHHLKTGVSNPCTSLRYPPLFPPPIPLHPVCVCTCPRCGPETWAVAAQLGTLCKLLWGTSTTDQRTKEVLVP
uniref:Isocitrate dehydrogenase (NAD(+)) 3 non-catalytic subunit beta n=1 Tax=Oncorhynchus mykiss TaxID=8022 RepID=A0A8K9WRA8_ONCMY